MDVTVNGEKKTIPADLDLESLLKHLQLPLRLVAIELNDRVVRKTDWPETIVGDGDKIEIVHFVGGG